MGSVLSRPRAFLGSIQDFGCKADGSTDDTTALQAFINTTSNVKLKILEAGTYKTTAPLTFPAGGTRIQGVGSGGDFFSVLKPVDCVGLDFDACHHVTLQQIMLWPQGTTKPTHYIRFRDGYCNTLRDFRIHNADTNYYPTVTAIDVVKNSTPNYDLIFENLILRTDGASNYPIGIRFAADCGSVQLHQCDLETSNKIIQWLGGHISLTNCYTERAGTHVLELNPSSDSYCSFHVHGGLLIGSNSSHPIAIRAGAKNVYIEAYTDILDHSAQGHIYDVTNVSNVEIKASNHLDSAWFADVIFTPAQVRFTACSPHSLETPTYGTSITPTYPIGTVHRTVLITATNGTGFTVNRPTEAGNIGKPQAGSRMTITIKNTSGGALGTLTWGTGYKTGAAWTQPANATNRSITFYYDGTSWYEETRSAADVTN